ncbi:MAG: hypothetical protein HYU88_05500 [Chloroflexi bacterium]|nr:hypothetical protein [Chloroflexota bacterium]
MAATARAKVLGLPDHPLVVLPHPFINRSAEEVAQLAAQAVEQIAAGLVRQP